MIPFRQDKERTSKPVRRAALARRDRNHLHPFNLRQHLFTYAEDCKVAESFLHMQDRVFDVGIVSGTARE